MTVTIGNIDRRQEVDGQRLIAEDAEDHQRQHQHDGEDRTADCDVVEIHDCSFGDEF